MAPPAPSNAPCSALSRIQPRQPIRRADVQPLAAVYLSPQAAGRDGTLEQRQQRKLPWCAAFEEFRPIHPDACVGETVGVALHHEIALEPEITARMMRRIGR